MLPFYATHLGARPLVVTLIISSFFFAQLLSAPFWGRFSDRYGRRPALLVGLASSAIAYALFGLANSIWLLFLFRMVQGAGGGTTGVVQAYVSDSVPPEKRAEALGWISAATSAGVMIGPLVGSLATYFGQSGPGFVAAGLCMLNVLVRLEVAAGIAPARRPPTPRVPRRRACRDAPKPRRQPLLRSVLKVLSDPGSPVSSLIWIYAIGMLAFMGMNGILALYLGKVYGFTEHTIGYLYGYIGAIGIVMRAVLLGPTVRRFGEVGVTRMGSLSLVLGLALVAGPRHARRSPSRSASSSWPSPSSWCRWARRCSSRPPPPWSPAAPPGPRWGRPWGSSRPSAPSPGWSGRSAAGGLYEVDIRFPFWAAADGDAGHQLPHLAADRGGAGEGGAGRGAGDGSGVGGR